MIEILVQKFRRQFIPRLQPNKENEQPISSPSISYRVVVCLLIVLIDRSNNGVI